LPTVKVCTPQVIYSIVHRSSIPHVKISKKHISKGDHMKKFLFLTLVLGTSISAFAHDFTIVMKNKAVIQRYYNNQSFNTASLSDQCDRIKGKLLESVETVSGSTSVRARVGICYYPEIVLTSEASKIENKKQKAEIVAVASLRYPNGSGTATLSEKCETMGGTLIDSRSEGTGEAYDTLVGGGICKLSLE
jgi:hypothetical protein